MAFMAVHDQLEDLFSSLGLGPWETCFSLILQISLVLLLVVLLLVAFIKCCMEQMGWIWSQPWSIELIRLDNRVL